MTSKISQFIILGLLVLNVAWVSAKPDANEASTLGVLIPLSISATTDVTPIGTQALIESYQGLIKSINDSAVEAADDAEIIAAVSARIADLELILQDQLTAESEEKGDGSYLSDYSKAIAAYKVAIELNPEGQNSDQLYYQLAKANDLAGNSNEALKHLSTLVRLYPYSQYVTEAQFRRGDYLFSRNQYRPAQDAYQAVIDAGEDSVFYENAVYMNGWSLFKRNLYQESALSFTQVLDRTMPEDGKLDGVKPSQQSLVDDSLRILGILFSYLDGAATIATIFDQIGPRVYESLLYEGLADLYISQERYRDAIKTFRLYIDRNPYADQAPYLQNRIIATMQKARFYNEAFTAKKGFIDAYEMSGIYYQQVEEENQQYIRSYLYVYIDEVARFYHARAQKQKKSLRQFRKAPPARQKKMLKDYATAIKYYDYFTVSFPNDEHVAEKHFMRGEAYSELKDYSNAIAAYERAAYDYGINVFSEDAAYASILAYNKLIKNTKEPEIKQQFVQRKLGAQVAFAEIYGFSRYARPVMLDSIDMMYVAKDYVRAAEQAQRFLELKPAPVADERLAVLLVLAHSQFETQQYANAEKAYYETLELMSKTDKRRRQLIDRIAASVYKQAETLAAEGKKIEAVEQLLRVGKISPTSKYRKNAEYDAGAYLLQAEQWQRALEVLTVYRKRYDRKRNDLDITGKIILAYEGLEQLDKAAAELQYVVANAKDPEKKRQALYLSAEYYERAGDNAKALSMYKRYAKAYPLPFDLAMETRFKISEMYNKDNDQNRRRYWLESIIVADNRAGKNRNDRSRYLAAYSRNVFAADYLKDFQKIRLTSPLRKSLGRKKKAMDTVLKKYKQIIGYEIQEFTTQATYHIGTVYSRLSADLLKSQRPKGFSAIELEQYDLLLEEQAYPFEESAIEIHEGNVKNSWSGNYDKWVQRSIDALSELVPGQYNKKEQVAEYSDVAY